MDITGILKKKFDILESRDNKTSDIIYEKIKDSEIPHSENKNGIFINLSCISESQKETLISLIDKEYIIDVGDYKEIELPEKKSLFLEKSNSTPVIEYKPFIINDLEKTIIDYSLS